MGRGDAGVVASGSHGDVRRALCGAGKAMLNNGTVVADRYQIVRLIGEGGMGSVYEAEHISVRRKVAIKVLLPEYARKHDSVVRFEREAQAAGEIGHEGIVEVLDFGVHSGLPYIVMEYLAGISLADRLDEQRVLPIGEAARIMGQVIAALGAAHHVGIIHRDLKPENVFVVQRSGRQFAKLLDFGISKFKSTDGVVSKSLTKTGALMGTPYYMAPEQALARRDIDHRVDLYSAGVMLYEMATGQLPFVCESQAELLMAVVYQKPPALPPRAVRPDIPADYEALIVKAMSPDRANRFQDAASFLEALKPFGELADTVTPAPPVAPRVSIAAPEVNAARPTSMTWEGSDIAVSGLPGASSSHGPRDWRFAVGAVVAGAAVAALGGLFALAHDDGAMTASVAIQSDSRAAATRRTHAILPPVQLELDDVPSDGTVRLDGVVTPLRVLHLVRGTRHHLEFSSPGRVTFETDVMAEPQMPPLAVALDPVPVSAGGGVGSGEIVRGVPPTQGLGEASRRGRVRIAGSPGTTASPGDMRPPVVPAGDGHHDPSAGHVLAPTSEF